MINQRPIDLLGFGRGRIPAWKTYWFQGSNSFHLVQRLTGPFLSIRFVYS
jgi:hypothetical protein